VKPRCPTPGPGAHNQSCRDKQWRTIALQIAISQVWGCKHAFIDRDKLARGVVFVRYDRSGLASVPGSGLRNPDMQHRPWRAAFFRDSDSSSPVLSLRDVVVCAVWTWSKAVRTADVKASYQKTCIFPFMPDGWKAMSQVAEKRNADATTKTLPAKRWRAVDALRKSSPHYTEVPVPQPTDINQLIGTSRTRNRIARQQDGVIVEQFLSKIMVAADTMDGVAKAEHLLFNLLAWSGNRGLVKAKADLVTGGGEVTYAPSTAASYNHSAARVMQSKTGALQNLTPGENRTGSSFSVGELEANRKEARECTEGVENALRRELEAAVSKKAKASSAA